VEETIEELDFAINAENEGGKATWAECFSTRNKLWMRTGHGMMLQFIQQLNGQNFYCKCARVSSVLIGLRVSLLTLLHIIDYYGDTFFQSAGTT
jgi:SP family sugar:H+ symporter-like MFS transporter